MNELHENRLREQRQLEANGYMHLPLFYLLKTLFPQDHVRRLPTRPVADRDDPGQDSQTPAERFSITGKVGKRT
jgi:hypothetical protein